MPSPTVITCSQYLANQKLTIAFAESATAGRMAAEFSLAPTSGEVLIGGLVCYDAMVKEKVLGISKEMIDHYSPESAEVTELLAFHLRKHFVEMADVWVAITGLTTPGGSESPDKPVGTMFVHVLSRSRSYPLRKTFRGSPEQIVVSTIEWVAEQLLSMSLR